MSTLTVCIPVGTSPLALFVTLACQGLVFVVLYLTLAFVFRIRALREVAAVVLPKLTARLPFFGRVARHLGVSAQEGVVL